MLCGFVLQRGNGGDGCELAYNLCMYDLRKGDLFVLYVGVVVFIFWLHLCLRVLI